MKMGLEWRLKYCTGSIFCVLWESGAGWRDWWDLGSVPWVCKSKSNLAINYMQLPLNTPHSQPHSITWDFSHTKDSKMRNKLSEYKELFDPSRQLLGQYNRHKLKFRIIKGLWLNHFIHRLQFVNCLTFKRCLSSNK